MRQPPGPEPRGGARCRPARLTPLEESPAAGWRALRGVLADIDGTLTADGRIGSAVVDALERLTAAGLTVAAITGRPAGWCDLIARLWPVDAVVGENGAFAFRYDRARRRMIRHFAEPAETRARNRRRLDAVARDILRRVPGAAVASDQAYREADLAIDWREDVEPLAPQAVAEIVRIFEEHGAAAKVSSIHVNGWFGDHDKLTMTRTLMREEFGVDLAAERDLFAYVGDSPNDAPMFDFFPNAVGVANVRAFADRCAALPAWVTHRPEGAGFVELADVILAARAPSR